MVAVNWHVRVRARHLALLRPFHAAVSVVEVDLSSFRRRIVQSHADGERANAQFTCGICYEQRVYVLIVVTDRYLCSAERTNSRSHRSAIDRSRRRLLGRIASMQPIESVPKIGILNDTINLFFLNCTRHFASFET